VKLDLLYIRSLFTFRTLGHVKTYAIVFFQTLVAAILDCGKVCEKIIAACVGSNEAKAFGIIKPFHYTCCHICTFLLKGRHPKKFGLKIDGSCELKN